MSEEMKQASEQPVEPIVTPEAAPTQTHSNTEEVPASEAPANEPLSVGEIQSALLRANLYILAHSKPGYLGIAAPILDYNAVTGKIETNISVDFDVFGDLPAKYVKPVLFGTAQLAFSAACSALPGFDVSQFDAKFYGYSARENAGPQVFGFLCGGQIVIV